LLFECTINAIACEKSAALGSFRSNRRNSFSSAIKRPDWNYLH
jgi:hypothetical protein